MFRVGKLGHPLAGLLTLLALAAAACGPAETVEVPVEKIVTKEVVREVQVEKIVTQEVIKEVEVPAPVEALDPLIIGNLTPFTGSISQLGQPFRNSVVLAADHVNRAGGIQGASVVVVSRDTAVSPVQGVDAARSLVDVEKAVAIVGAVSSGVTVAVAQSVTIPKERLIVSGGSTAPSITTLDDKDFLFRTNPSDAAQGIVLARLAVEQGFKKVGIMYVNNAYGEGLVNQFEQSFAELGGTVTGKAAHEEVQQTYVAELERATEGGPDALLTVSYPGQAEVYVREALEGGYADRFLFVTSVRGTEWIDAINAWEALDGTVGTTAASPPRTEWDAFEAAYLETYGTPVAHPFMGGHYDAAAVIALAAAKAGNTTDSAAIRDALRDVANPPGEVVGPGREGMAKALRLIADGKDINYEGAAGIIDFDENGDVVGPIEIWQVKDGEIQATGRFEWP